TKNVLLEISTVSVPANAMALAKSKGIDISPLEKILANEKTETNFTNEADLKGVVKVLGDILEELKTLQKAGVDTKVPQRSNTPAKQGNKKKSINNPKKFTVSSINKAVRALLSEKRKLS